MDWQQMNGILSEMVTALAEDAEDRRSQGYHIYADRGGWAVFVRPPDDVIPQLKKALPDVMKRAKMRGGELFFGDKADAKALEKWMKAHDFEDDSDAF